MKCEVCGMGPMQGVTIHRVGPKGAPTTQWRCDAHLGENTVDEGVAEVVAILESADEEQH